MTAWWLGVALLCGAEAAAQPGGAEDAWARAARAHEDAEQGASSPEARLEARVTAAEALADAGLRQSALGIAYEIVVNEAPPARRRTVALVAALALVLPRPANATDVAGRYDEADVAAATGLDARARERIQWLRGRSLYLRSSFDEAIPVLLSIPQSSGYRVQARLLAAAAHVRIRRPAPAARLFREVIDQLGPRPSTARRREAREVALLSLGRLYFERGVAERDATSFALAGGLFATIPRRSVHYAAAQLGLAWTAWHADADERLARALDALPRGSPEREGEGAILRVLLAIERCREGDMRAAIAEHRRTSGATRRAVERFLAAHGTPEDLEPLVAAVVPLASGRAPVPADLRLALRPILADRLVGAHLAYLRMLEAEHATLRAAPAAFQNHALGARVADDLLVARSFAVQNLGETVRGRLQRWLVEQEDDAAQLDYLESSWACR